MEDFPLKMVKFLQGEVDLSDRESIAFTQVSESWVLKKYFACQFAENYDMSSEVVFGLLQYPMRQHPRAEEIRSSVPDEEYLVISESLFSFCMTLLGGLCCCGCLEALKEELLPLLRYVNLRQQEDWKKSQEHHVDMPELFWKFLAKEGLFEHGGSVMGSWLSPFGQEFLELLEVAEQDGALDP